MKVVSFDPTGLPAENQVRFLSESGQGLFQSPEWASAKARDGWRPWGLAAMDGETICASIIALERRFPGGLSPFGGIWHAPRGPVANFESTTGRDGAAALLEALEALVRRRGGTVIRISPDVEAGTFPAGWLEGLGYRPAIGAPWMHTATFRVDLAREEESILGGMEGRVRSAIRKARRAGIRIDAAKDPASFGVFYAMHRATGDRNAFSVISGNRMQRIWEESARGGWGRVFLSRSPGGEPLSGAFVLAPGRRCHYLFGASTPLCRKHHANELLHWEAMKWARKRGCDSYDLEGVAGRLSPGHPLWGNYLFKRGFGGRYVELAGEYERVLRPRLHRILAWGVARLRAGPPPLKREKQVVHHA